MSVHGSMKVKELSRQIRGVSYAKEDASDMPFPGSVPILRANNITDDGLHFDDLVYVPSKRVGAEQMLRRGDIVIAASSGSLDVVGKAAPLRNGFRGSFGAFCKALRPNKEVDPSYFAHFFRTLEYRRTISRLAAGANINNLRNEHLDDLEIPVPPLEEQRRIAAILDEADALRQKRRLALQKLDSLAQSIFLDMFGDPISNPKQLPRKRLGDLIEFIGGSQPPKSVFSDTDGPGKVRLIQIRDFKTDRYKTYIPREFARRAFEEDDVMIGRYGPPVFQIFRGLSGSYNVALMKASPRNGTLKSFIYYLLRDQGIQRVIVDNSERTAGQSGVNLQLLESLEAYQPTLDVQLRFERIAITIDGALVEYRKHLENTEQLFSSLQSRAFRGEL